MKMKINKTPFLSCSLREADFTGTDLSGSKFENCDLDRAVFMDSILEKADLKTAINYSIDPERNKIRQAAFSLSGVPGLLYKYNINIS